MILKKGCISKFLESKIYTLYNLRSVVVAKHNIIINKVEKHYSPRMSVAEGERIPFNYFGAERVWRSRRRENLSIVMKKNLYK